MLAAKMMMAVGAAQGKLYVDDVFSTYLRTGTGADAVVTTGIDMTQGYMLWSKGRSGATDHAIYDSARGVTFDLASNTTAAQTTQVTGLKAISTTGHTVGSLAKINTSSATYVDWVFREASKFFKPTTISHTNGTPTNVAFPALETLGMVVAKITNGTGDWIAWHRSLTAGNNFRLNTTAAQSGTDAWLSVSGTTVTLSASAPTGSYVVYGWAHDTSADGIIQCGSYVGNGSSAGPTVALGWEPQYVMIKSATVGGAAWCVYDIMRGITDGGVDHQLTPNSSQSENGAYGSINWLKVTPTGFQPETSDPYGAINLSGQTYIYLAIRRPNKPPTTGTQVYNAIARTGTGAAATVTGVGFAPDLVLGKSRSQNVEWPWNDRLRGVMQQLLPSSTGSEQTASAGFTNLLMDGVTVGTSTIHNQNTIQYINHFFRRAPGFMDVVCDTGTGSAHTVAHNLTVAPELVIRKSRSGATQWEVWHSALAASEKLVLNSTAAKATDTTAWNSTAPTASVFTVGTGANVNTNTATYVTYLFATLAGISKVGSYTGNGTSQTINCGFTTGARFVLIKQVNSTGDWYVWDTARGIIAGNDPHLSLNTTAAEVTTDDSIDPDSSGFIVNQLAATNINVNAASYIYLAIA